MLALGLQHRFRFLNRQALALAVRVARDTANGQSAARAVRIGEFIARCNNDRLIGRLSYASPAQARASYAL